MNIFKKLHKYPPGTHHYTVTKKAFKSVCVYVKVANCSSVAIANFKVTEFRKQLLLSASSRTPMTVNT